MLLDRDIENERQAQKVKVNSTTVTFKQLTRFFTIINLFSTLNLHDTFPSPQTSFDKSVAYISVDSQHFDEILSYWNPLSFATKNSSNDKFTLKEVLNQDNMGSFFEAMAKKVEAH